MIIEQKLKDIQTRASEIEAQMNSGNVSGDELTKLSKEYSRISEILPLINEYFQTTAGIADAIEMQHDPELRSIAVEQLAELNHALPEIEKKLQIALLPRDDADDNSVIMEIRAGVGGEESALFAGDLYNQYKSYALRHGWQVEVIEENATSLRGYKEIVFKIDGVGAYARMKFESGIHRVQRVPETEAGGRIHTSAASVAVMPEAKDIDVVIDDKIFALMYSVRLGQAASTLIKPTVRYVLLISQRGLLSRARMNAASFKTRRRRWRSCVRNCMKNSAPNNKGPAMPHVKPWWAVVTAVKKSEHIISQNNA